jgi:hypothetical protein
VTTFSAFTWEGTPDALEYPCVYLTSNGLFDFKNLRSQSDYSTTSNDHKSITFNFCKPVHGCGSSTFASVTFDGKCVDLTDGDERAVVTSNVETQAGSSGIKLLREGTSVCPDDQTQNLGFEVDVICNPSLATPQIQIMAPEPGETCRYHVTVEHIAGCPAVDFTLARQTLGTLLLSCGVLLTYLGFKSMKWFMTVIVQFTVLLLLTAFFISEGYLAVIDPSAPEKQKSVAMGAIAICVALVSTWVSRWLFTRFIKFAPTVIGCAAGYMATLYAILVVNGVCSVFQTRNAVAVVGETGQIAWAICGIIVGGWIGFNFAFVFILCMQCFVSAYLIVRGVSLWVNYGFPNEASLIDNTYGREHGPKTQIPSMFYAYLGMIVVIWAGSFYYTWQKAHEWKDS